MSISVSTESLQLKPKSIAKVIAWCMLSFGLYVVFRLYQLSNILNQKVRMPISKGFMFMAIAIHLLSFVSLITYFVFDGSSQLLITSKVLHVISSLFHFVWIMKVRNRMNEISGAVKGDINWLRPFLSTFLHVIYMQYKINRNAAGIKKLQAT